MNRVTVVSVGTPIAFECHEFVVSKDDSLFLFDLGEEQIAYFPPGAWQGVWLTERCLGTDKTILAENTTP
jgi:hypothetical protein